MIDNNSEDSSSESEESLESQDSVAEESDATLWAENLIREKLSENNENGLSEQVIGSIVYIYAMKQFAEEDQDQLAYWKEAKSVRSVLNRLKREGKLRFSSNRWHSL